MALLFLVRHGQASFGTANYDRLSDVGRQQARWLGEYFAGRELKFRRVLTGTLARQQDTAREILAAMGVDPSLSTVHAGLDEYSAEPLYAAHTGGADPLAHQKSDYRGYWRTFKAAMYAWSAGALEGVPETWEAFGARTADALEAACAGLSREDAVLVVSSGGAICRALSAILACPGETAIELNLQFRNAAFCELITGGDTMRLLGFNAVPHLDTPERRASITFA
jgi:broad specificity phosphatase PhoE